MTTETRKGNRQVRPWKLIQPPSDPLRTVIPPEVRDDWRRNPTPELIRRLEHLCACGPKPSDKRRMRSLMHHRAVRAAWETYVYCAFACGLFDGDRGKDLRGRLASRNPPDFRSAMSECLACWFLAGRLGLPVHGRAPGRGAKMLDMKAIMDCQNVGVEVKAPYRERPPAGQPGYGHDGDLLAQCLDAANKKFADNVANILVLVPQLRIPISTSRLQLVTALYGEEKITWLIDTQTGGTAGPVTTEFFPEGRLLRRRQPSGTLVKPNGMPGFTRVSAVIVIEEQMKEKYPHPLRNLLALPDVETAHQIWPTWERAEALARSCENEAWLVHSVLVAHNPCARHALNPDLFRGYVQFGDLGTGYGWNDGEPL